MSDEAKLGPVARRLAATERVLCFEDEPDIAAFLRAYFRAAGYDFVHVDPDDVDAAMAAMDSHDPDLVLLDLRLRGFSGMEIYRRVRADEQWAFTPILIVSAHAQSDPKFEQPSGVDGFVPKPFNTNTLADNVRAHINAAKDLAARGRDDTYELMSPDYLTARLRDEIAHASGPFSFALVQLASTTTITAEVGEEGLQYVVGELLKHARALLPSDVVLGATSGSELALILPGRDSDDALAILSAAIEAIDGTFGFAGGAEVPVNIVGGLASYPRHGSEVDSLFMAADLALADAVDAREPVRVAIG